ncbi:phosphate uptake regulator PhoU [Candidatus Woesearchaeota archaeon]|nr:phosphate uptake regulator PhoU [Candidatus Woesearchaeota archaeon]
MKRKVIKQGHNTLTITLPAKWVEQHSIKAGDELDLDENGNKLIVMNGGNDGKKEIDIEVTDFDRTSIVYLLRYLYRSGFNVRAIRFSNQTTYYYRQQKPIPVFNVVQLEVRRLIGVEVIERKNNSVILQFMIDEKPEDYDSFLRRAFYMTSLMFDHLLDGLKEKDTTSLSLIAEDHDTLTKFISYCYRVINLRNQLGAMRRHLAYTLLESIELIVDLLEELAIETMESQKKPSACVLAILNSCKELFDSFQKMYYSFNPKEIIALAMQRNDIMKKVNSCHKTPSFLDISLASKLQLIPAIIIRNFTGLSLSLQLQ